MNNITVGRIVFSIYMYAILEFESRYCSTLQLVAFLCSLHTAVQACFHGHEIPHLLLALGVTWSVSKIHWHSIPIGYDNIQSDKRNRLFQWMRIPLMRGVPLILHRDKKLQLVSFKWIGKTETFARTKCEMSCYDMEYEVNITRIRSINRINS